MPLFTKDNAREMAIRGNIARWHPEPQPATIPKLAEDEPDQFATELSCACNQVLKELVASKKPTYKAALARTIRDLRETYHLVTGKAKPGVTKPTTDRPRRTTSGGPTPIDSSTPAT